MFLTTILNQPYKRSPRIGNEDLRKYMKNQRQNIGRFIFKDDPFAFQPANQSDRKDEAVSSLVHRAQDLKHHLSHIDDEYRSIVDPF